ncbi:MAG TPA: DUF349 domain-containing protein, partial [Flavobacteriales bacterium]|nr:DUF349 domain-containing protein [Flavobacteriales bacterium]
RLPFSFEYFKQLQATWKDIPTAGPKDNKLWRRFRAAGDAFFQARKDYHAAEGEKQIENLKLKEALIEEIKKTQLTEKPAEDFNLMKDFIRRWNEIEFVPIKEKKRIHDVFSKALDEKYSKLKGNREEKEKMQFRLKVEKLSGSDDPQALKKERKFLQDKINILRDTIYTYETNLSFFSKSKKTVPLKQQVEKKIALSKKDLEKLEAKMKLFAKISKPAGAGK